LHLPFRVRLERPAKPVAATIAAGAAALVLAACGGSEEPANGMIAFARSPSGAGWSDIYVVHPAGTLRRLTHGAHDRSPAWSPDGNRLLFLRSDGHGRPALHVTDADGGEIMAIPRATADEASWSPDGRRIVFTEGSCVCVVDADGTNRDVLVGLPTGSVHEPSWSPDGRDIVFVGGEGSQGSLYLIDTEGGSPRRLTNLLLSLGRPYAPTWSPDGSQIAFLLPGGVYVTEADGDQPKRIARVSAGVYPSSLTWSPDGRSIAYAVVNLDAEPSHSGLFVVSADGGDPRRLTRAIDANPSWSPDGRRLALARFTGFHVSQIVLLNADGSGERLLSGAGFNDGTPAWQSLPG
jgi:Tol biopolymer transport system component